MSATPVTPHSLDLPPEVARAAEHLFDRKAQDVTLLDLRGISTATDFFLIATGTSDTHVSAISDHVVEELRQMEYAYGPPFAPAAMLERMASGNERFYAEDM